MDEPFRRNVQPGAMLGRSLGMLAKRKHGAHRARTLVEGAVACAVGALVLRTWIVAGLLTPVVVHGGSMAPALLGAHRTWQCRHCGRVFACNLESLPAPGRTAVCPQCGAANDSSAGADAPGDRLLVDRAAFCWRTPARWETIVVRSPDQPARLCVKRVVGLPGETLQIVDGDVWIDGAIARKGIGTLRAMAVTVSDPRATDRWRPVDASWRLADGWFVHDARASDASAWLAYHHAEHAVRGAADGTILDNGIYDQSESRVLHPVSDVMLRGEIATAGVGWLVLRACSRRDAFEVKLNLASGATELWHNGRPVVPPAVLVRRPPRTFPFEFAVADHRVQLALAGGLILEYDYQPADAHRDGPPEPLALGARGGRVRVRNLEVLRDVYYTGGPAGGASQYRLTAGEYFLLGDNSARSLDSRLWSPGGVSEHLLVGRALAW